MGSKLVATIDMNTGYAFTKPHSMSPFGKSKAMHSGQLKLDLNFQKDFLGGGIHSAVLFRGEERFMGGAHVQLRGRLFGKVSAFLSLGSGVSVNVHENAKGSSRYAFYVMPTLGLQVSGKRIGVGLALGVPLFVGEGHTPVTTGFLLSLCTTFYWTKGTRVAKSAKSSPTVVVSKPNK